MSTWATTTTPKHQTPKPQRKSIKAAGTKKYSDTTATTVVAASSKLIIMPANRIRRAVGHFRHMHDVRCSHVCVYASEFSSACAWCRNDILNKCHGRKLAIRRRALQTATCYIVIRSDCDCGCCPNACVNIARASQWTRYLGKFDAIFRLYVNVVSRIARPQCPTSFRLSISFVFRCFRLLAT